MILDIFFISKCCGMLFVKTKIIIIIKMSATAKHLNALNVQRKTFQFYFSKSIFLLSPFFPLRWSDNCNSFHQVLEEV